jgi:HK97 family phage portal protein
MTVFSGFGDQLVSVNGLPTGLARPSVPLSAYYGGGQVNLVGDGQAVSYTMLYRSQPWIAAAVNKLARQISRLPLKVYEKDSQNNNVRLPADHGLVKLLTQPFARGGPTHLKQKIALPMLLHGNALLAKDRPTAGAPPVGLKPMDWRYVIPHGYAGVAGDLIPGEVEFWEFTYPDDRTFIRPEEILHFKWDAPDSAVGVSPLQQLGVTLFSEDAAQRYAAAYFRNGGRLSGAVVMPPEVKDRQIIDQVKREVNELYAGVDRNHGVAVMGGGATWQEMGQSAAEAQLIETRQVNREEIAAVYDIPPPMIGILDHATYSNISEQHLMLYQTVLGPWLTLIEETMKAQLLDSEPVWEGLFVEFDVDEQLKGNPIDRSKAQALWITHGVYTINEVRKLENLPQIDNPVLDQPMIPVNNMAPATSLNPQLEQPLPGEPVPDAPGEPALTPTLASHIARAGERVASKAGAGHPDPWDRQRFVRELAADLNGMLGGKAEQVAGMWGDALTAVVDHAQGDPKVLRDSFLALAR